MSSSTLPSSEDPNLQERKRVNDLIGEIQGKLQTLKREKFSPQDSARIARLELENSKLKKDLAFSEVQINELEQNICDYAAEREVEISNLKKELKEAQARIRELEKKARSPRNLDYILRKNDEEISQLKSKISGLEADLKEAHEQIEVLEFRENEDETAQIIRELQEERHQAHKEFERLANARREKEEFSEALERRLRKEINKIGASLGQCRAQKADVERKLKEAQEKIEVLESRDVRGHTRSSDDRRSGPSQRYPGGANRDVRRPYDRYDTRRSSPNHSPVRRSGVCPNSRAAARDVRGYDSYEPRRCSDYRREPYDDRRDTRALDRHQSARSRYFYPFDDGLQSSVRYPSRITPAASIAIGRRRQNASRYEPGSAGSYGDTYEGFRRRESGFPISGRGQGSLHLPRWARGSGFPQQTDNERSTPQSSGFPRAQELDNQGSSTMGGPSDNAPSSPRGYASVPLKPVVAENDRAETSDTDDDDW